MSGIKQAASYLWDGRESVIAALLAVLVPLTGWLATTDGASWLFGKKPTWISVTQVAVKGHCGNAFMACLLLFFVASVWHICATVSLRRTAAKVVDLEEERNNWLQDVYEVADGWCLGLAKGKLAFGSDGTTERISIYKHDDDKATFVQFGRFCYHADWNKPSGRQYPDTEGHLAEAWRNGSVFVNDYPDSSKGRGSGIARPYLDRHRKANLGEETASKLRMQSRLYYGRGIRSADDSACIAVVLVEALTPDRYTKEDLDVVFDDPTVLEHTTRLIEKLARRLPSSTAEEVEGA